MTLIRFRLRLAGIVIGAAIFRVLYVLVVKRDDDLRGDEAYYQAQAVVIANGKWFESPFPPGGFAADHVPLTALLLAPVSWVDDHSVLAQRLLMALVGAAVVAGVGGLALKLFDRRAALIAAALAAFYGAFWLNDVVVMSETLATAGVVGLLWCSYGWLEGSSRRRAAALGAMIGLAGLARAELLVLGAVLATAITVTKIKGERVGQRDGSGRRMLGHAGYLVLAGATALLVIAPWVVRNQVRFDESTIMSTQDGLAVLGANCPPVYSGDFVGFWAIECGDLVEVDPTADQSVRSSAYRAAGFDYIGEHVDELPQVMVARVGRGLSVYRPDQMTRINETEGRARWASWIATLQFWVLAPLAIVGLLRWRSRLPRWPLVLTIGFTLVLFAAVYGIPRFRVPMEVVVVLGAAAVLRSWMPTNRSNPDPAR